MSAEPGVPGPAVGRLRAWPTARRWRRVRLGLLAASLLLALLVVLLGVHPSSLERLRADLAAGRTSSVEVLGEGVDARADRGGWSTQEVRWRSGLVERSAPVTSLPPGTSLADVDEAAYVPEGAVAVTGDVADELRALAPDVEVERGPASTTAYSLFDVSVPGWLLVASGMAWLTAVVAVSTAPRTWRMTGWGWGWLVLLVPLVGIPAFCLLSGPTPPLPRARTGRRLGGGPASSWPCCWAPGASAAADRHLGRRPCAGPGARRTVTHGYPCADGGLRPGRPG
ncbi:hypothetical protein [Pseudokineococcus sp. 1T1Z-3]|uniref:hypothetical protein n=1 Tax=Pseudokineococcus sp. 1T1Z-3 TaxID=3132745 RepID=UPI0030B395AD